MANQKHLAKLREGVRHWNEWREEHPDVRPNLSGADLRRLELAGSNLVRANLSDSILASLSLSRANLSEAILAGADLTGTLLRQADLTRADFSRAQLARAEFSETVMAGTCFMGAKGLDKAIHLSKSFIDHETLERSARVPGVFLVGCGFSESDVEAYRGRLDIHSATKYKTCFFSYSSRDKSLARTIFRGLTARGVDCFFDEESIRPGELLSKRIISEIESRERFILLITSASVVSKWVEAEVSRAQTAMIQRGNEAMILPIRVEPIAPESMSWWARDVTKDISYIPLRKRGDPGQVGEVIESLLRALS